MKKCEIKLFSVTKENIEKMESLIIKNIPPCIGIMKVHQVLWTCEAKHQLDMCRLSCFNCGPEVKCKHYHIVFFYPLGKVTKKKENGSQSKKTTKKLESEVYSSNE